MKLKLLILFLLVFGAIGQTIFLNIDAKSDFLKESSKNYHINASITESYKSPIQSSEVVVTIRQHDSEVLNQNATMNVDSESTTTDSKIETNVISAQPKIKKPCSLLTKEERLICQKAKDEAKQKHISGSNHTKNSTIQIPTP